MRHTFYDANAVACHKIDGRKTPHGQYYCTDFSAISVKFLPELNSPVVVVVFHLHASNHLKALNLGFGIRNHQEISSSCFLVSVVCFLAALRCAFEPFPHRSMGHTFGSRSELALLGLQTVAAPLVPRTDRVLVWREANLPDPPLTSQV